MNQGDKMENERGKTQTGEGGDHGWAPDSGTGHSKGKSDGERTGETVTDNT